MRAPLAVLVLFCLTASAVAWATESVEYESAAARLFRHTEFFDMQTKPAVSSDRSFRRDPLQPLIDAWGNVLHTTASQNKGLMIQGIVDAGDAAMVLIDNKYYKKGDTVENCRILEIRRDGILVQKATATFFISLYSEAPADK